MAALLSFPNVVEGLIEEDTKWYRGVGWFALDPSDETTPPFAQVVIVGAPDKDTAFNAAFNALETPPGAELLNWYVREIPQGGSC